MKRGLTEGRLMQLYKRHMARTLDVMRRRGTCEESVEADVVRGFGFLYEDVLRELRKNTEENRYVDQDDERSVGVGR